jgi:Flp pilus assembly pilin Flp
MRQERGQATIEYLALIAVLAVLLVAAAAVASGGAPGVANAVLAQVRHALCIVTGGGCAAERLLPCVVASERDAHHIAVTILLARLDGDRYILREKMSDGTVRLTLAHRGGGGVELGIGSRLKAALKGRVFGVDDEARGGAEGVLGYGEVFVARDDREADEILRSIRRHVPLVGGGGPEPRERIVEGGTRGLGRFGIGGVAAGASVEGLTESIVSVRRDEHSGQVTITLNAGSSGWALLNAVMTGPSGLTDRQVSFTVTLDRDHRPTELGLSASGTLSGGATLPTGLAGPLGVRDSGDAQLNLTGRRWDLGARVDLRDPEVAAAWAAFRHDPTSASAIRALAAQLRTRASLDVRRYAVSTDSDGAAAGLGAGPRVGGEIDHTTDRARLLAAATRPPGGLWERRTDCVAA